MTSVIVENFGGVAPKIDPRKLAEGMAQDAQRVLLEGNALEPMKDVGGVISAGLGTDKSIFKDPGGTWRSFAADRDFVKAQVANDSEDRWLVSASSTDTPPHDFPQIRNGANTAYRLGVPAPDTAITTSGETAPSDPNDIEAEDITYVMTFVDLWGAEGPPGPASAIVTRVRDTDVTLTLPAAPAGLYNLGTGALKRIYRSNSGSDSSAFQFVKQVSIATVNTTDDVDNALLQEVIPSSTWIGPPDDDTNFYPNGPLIGLTTLANGVIAGHAAKTLLFTEPFLYHAWPVEYRITFDENIVGTVGIAAGLLVCTDSYPYIVAGVSPGSMSAVRLDVHQACVSKKSIVDMGDWAIYASPDGLIGVQSNGARLITGGLFNREQWQALVPSTIRAYNWEGKYVAFYNDGAEKGFIFDPRGGRNSFVYIPDYYEAGHYVPEDDILYVNDAGNLRAFNGGSTAQDYTWKTAKIVVPKAVSFSVIRIESWDLPSVDSIQCRIWADGTELTGSPFTFNSATRVYRLPPPEDRAKIWEVEFVTSNPISYFGLYEAMEEVV